MNERIGPEPIIMMSSKEVGGWFKIILEFGNY
jgi:hypothetical protein